MLTRDNLAKRREVEDSTCLFCGENETIMHLFFQCCVVRNVWDFISLWLNRSMGNDFISVASLWISNKKFMVCNIVSSAVLWVIWKLRNALCFQGVPWMGMKMVFAMLGRMQRNWMPGECGADSLSSGSRSKISTADHVEIGVIKVGSINCSAFEGLRKCDVLSV